MTARETSPSAPPPPLRADAAARAAARRLAEVGVEDPLRDARLLLRWAAGLSAEALAMSPEAPLSPAEAERFEAGVRARAARRPLSQIVGGRWFCGRWLRVTPDVLDPRPDSETLVRAALAHLAMDAAVDVLDLGVGSGCLLLSVLAERPAARGLGIDRSAAALAVARANADGLDPDAPGLAGRVRFAPGDWLDLADRAPLGRFEAILCNPPYIPAAEVDALAPEVAQFEPRLALTPGPDGLTVYRALAPRLAEHLTPSGAAFFEVGRGQAEDAAALFRAASLDAEAIADLDGVARVLRVTAPMERDAGNPAAAEKRRRAQAERG